MLSSYQRNGESFLPAWGRKTVHPQTRPESCPSSWSPWHGAGSTRPGRLRQTAPLQPLCHCGRETNSTVNEHALGKELIPAPWGSAVRHRRIAAGCRARARSRDTGLLLATGRCTRWSCHLSPPRKAGWQHYHKLDFLVWWFFFFLNSQNKKQFSSPVCRFRLLPPAASHTETDTRHSQRSA